MAKIMVVDDEADMIWAITNVLLTQNHSVISVSSGEEAVQKVQSEPLDLVLLDYRLPGIDGVQILERIKKIRPELPVIMVTGYGGIEEAVQSIKLGAAHYLAKPFDNDHLLEVTNKALQLNLLKKEGVFGKRLVEKIDPKSSEPISAHSAPAAELKSAFTPAKKGWPKVLAGMFLAAGIAGTAWVGFRWNQTHAASRDFAIPHSHVSGLSLGAENLWVCDWFTQSIYKYERKDGKMNLIKSFTVPDFHFTGIATAGEYIYTCDSWKRMIYKHTLNESLTIEASYKSPGDNPSGLYFDGQSLWSCDGNTKKIYQHTLDDHLTVVATYESQSRFPVGLVRQGDVLWYAGVGGILYGHRLGDGFRLESTLTLPSAKDQPQISAFTMQEGKVLVAYEGVGSLTERTFSDLPRASAQ